LKCDKYGCDLDAVEERPLFRLSLQIIAIWCSTFQLLSKVWKRDENLKIKIYKTVILPVVLYGCETWSFTLGEEHRLRVFENRVLRKIFGPKREEDGSWRTLHNDELHGLYSSPNIVRVIKSMRWGGHLAHMGEGRGAYRVLVGRPGGKRPLGRLRHRWEDNIKMDFGEIRINGANWIWLAQGRVQWQAFVNTVMNLWVS
jgi:hypothetical protein